MHMLQVWPDNNNNITNYNNNLDNLFTQLNFTAAIHVDWPIFILQQILPKWGHTSF